MTENTTDAGEGVIASRKGRTLDPGNEDAEVETPPNEVLAKKVIASLVDGHLISAADGERIRYALATGTLDAAEWKLAFENHLERHRVGDESK